MRILLADTAGFCMGVKRAVDLALELANEHRGNIYTIGPLIHNPQTVEMLEKKGVKVISDLSAVDSGTIIVRAHGMAPEQKQRVVDSGLQYFDATCPLVLRIQSTIKRYAAKGYTVIIVGDKGHAEVDGLLGYAGNHGIVVEKEQDLDDILDEKLCVVAQSTQNRVFFETIVNRLRKKAGEIKVFDTICDATTERQEEVRKLARKVEAMIIVGGHNSANTRRLAEISRSLNVKTFQIENERELNEKEIAGCENVGVTAGASTPNWVIEKVIDRLNALGGRGRNPILNVFSRLWQAIVKSDLFIGIGAGLLCFSTTILERSGSVSRSPLLLSIAISSCYVFAVHILNHYTDREYAQYKESYKLSFLEQHRRPLIALGTASVLGAIALSSLIGPVPLLILVFASVAGLIYNFRIVPDSIAKVIRIKRLRDIPASKNLLTALAWCVITVVVPAIELGKRFTAETWRLLFVVFVFAFTLVFTRSTLLDMRDIQGDLMLGNETLPIILGKRQTKAIMIILLLVCSALLVLGSLAGWVSSLGYFLLIPVAYCFLYLYLYHKRVISQGMSTEIATDMSFFITGGVAFTYYALSY